MAAQRDVVRAMVDRGRKIAGRKSAEGEHGNARARGVSAVVSRLQELAVRHGERFRPDEGWVSLGAGQKRDGA